MQFFKLFRNVLSLTGFAFVVVATAVGVSLMFADMFFGHPNPYTGILTYLILPLVSGFGFLIAMTGAFLRWRSLKKNPNLPPVSLPRIDLGNPRHRVWIFSSLAFFIVTAVLLSVTGYQAYHFTDSVQFCGQACHEPMKPEFTAYKHSPHARVACVECHIGPGADWFVRSKISGAYQVYSVAFNKYSRPIETPIKDLRPAQDTCERCHWPAKFFGAQQKTFTHFLSDENNSPWEIQALIRIGGGDPRTGVSTGIHWHMNIDKQIYYRDVDGKRMTIPWVRAVDKDGRATEYVSSENTLSPEELEKLPIRRMDCMDCHNRPAHIFPAPTSSLNHAFASNLLDRSLPYLKREAVDVMSVAYQTEQEGRAAIEQKLKEFYATNYPDLAAARKPNIDRAISVIQEVFSRTIFPEMKADWRAYPNHVGHLMDDGCFRCHDGSHSTSEGKTITNDCNACHTILAQGSPAEVAQARLEAQPFKHPDGEDVTELKCTLCHGSSPSS